MEPETIQQRLFVSASEKYGDRYIEHLLEQYKIYLGSVESVSDRRQKANEFFLALNTGLVAVLGFVVTKLEAGEVTLILLLASLAGTVMCYLWYRMIRSYKGLSTGKFAIVHAIEARLPLALYDAEWQVLGQGKNKKLYWPFSHIELLVPWIFVAIYTVLLLYSAHWSWVWEFLATCRS